MEGTGRERQDGPAMSAPRRRFGWCILAAGAALTAMTATAQVPASAATHNWIATGWNIHLLTQASPATAAHFFNLPSSYGVGASLTVSPVPAGFSTTPVLQYTSYKQFASDVQSGAITYPYHWVLYDPEDWSQTPPNEQQDPGTYLRLFGQLAHAHGYRVIEAPARNLGLVAGSACPKLSTETLDQWYVRCNVAGMAAAYSDVYLLQDEANTANLNEYAWLNSQARAQALTANPVIIMDSEVSTNFGTAAQMTAAAQSVNADGFYVGIPDGAINQAIQFLQNMQAAGY
jgi:hypothetical protein